MSTEETMVTWESLLTALHDLLKTHERRQGVLDEIDQVILSPTASAGEFLTNSLKPLAKVANASSGYIFQKVGSLYRLRYRTECDEPLRTGFAIRESEFPPSGVLLAVDEYACLLPLFPPGSSRFYCQRLMLAEDSWGALVLETQTSFLSETAFVDRVCAKLSVALEVLLSRDRVHRFTSIHSAFIAAGLDQQRCLELLGECALQLLGHSEKVSLQILLREPLDSDRVPNVAPPLEERPPLVVSWSSNREAIGVRVPFDSLVGRSIASDGEVLTDGLQETGSSRLYRAFPDGASVQQLVLVLKELHAREGFGALSIESTSPVEYSLEALEELRDLVSMASPILSAVRKRALTANQNTRVANAALENALARSSQVYRHRLASLLLSSTALLDLVQTLVSKGHKDRALEKASDLGEALDELSALLDRGWAEISLLATQTATNIESLIRSLEREERETFRRYVKVDFSELETLPLVRASGLLKEHLRNILANAVRAIEDKLASAPTDYVPEIAISGELFTVAHKRAGEDQHAVALLNRRVRLKFRDNGIGMDGERLARAFTPGFSTWGTLGFGLPAIRQYAKEQGGDVYVRSTQGEGTSVAIELPVESGRSDFE